MYVDKTRPAGAVERRVSAAGWTCPRPWSRLLPAPESHPDRVPTKTPSPGNPPPPRVSRDQSNSSNPTCENTCQTWVCPKGPRQRIKRRESTKTRRFRMSRCIRRSRRSRRTSCWAARASSGARAQLLSSFLQQNTLGIQNIKTDKRQRNFEL